MPDNWGTHLLVDRFLYEGSISKDFHFSSGVRLGPCPAWIFTDAELSGGLCYNDRNRLKNSEIAFSTYYSAASLGDPDPDWKSVDPVSKQSRARDQIALAQLALWIARPSYISARVLIHANEFSSKWVFRSLRGQDFVSVHPKDENRLIRHSDLLVAKELHQHLSSLGPNNPLRMATIALWTALTARWWQERFLMHWIALENLFGVESDTREVKYRLCQRLAFFISSNRKVASKRFTAAKLAYDVRSSVVHGLRVRNMRKEKADKVLYDTETMIRKAFIKLFSSNKLITEFSKRGRREIHLDALLFK